MNSLSEAIKQSNIKALLFDFDDTLYETKPIYSRGLKNAWEAFQKSGVLKACSKNEFYAQYSAAREKTKTSLATSPSKNSRLIYFHHLVTNLMGRPLPELIFALDESYSKAYAGIDFTKSRNILGTLKPKYKIAIVTNQTTQAQLIKLQALDPLGQLIDGLTTSEAAGVEKPDPRIFEMALRELNVSASECLMIGDDLIPDIHGALAANINALHLTGNPGELPTMQSSKPIRGQISSLDQLLDLLDLLP